MSTCFLDQPLKSDGAGVCPWRFPSSPDILFSKLPHPILFQVLKVLANLGSVLPRTISILSWGTTVGQWGSLGAKTHIKLPWTDGQKVLVLMSQVRKTLALCRTHSQLPALGRQRLVSFTITSVKPKTQTLGTISTSFIYSTNIIESNIYQGFPGSSAGNLQGRRPRFDSWVWKIRWRRDRLPTPVFLDLPGGSHSKESTCNAGDLGSIPGLGRFPGEGNDYPLQCSGLENSMDSPRGGKELDTTEPLSLFTFIYQGLFQGWEYSGDIPARM